MHAVLTQVVLGISSDASAQTITVDSNELFPVEPYYGEVLEYIDADGERRVYTYTNLGTLAHATLAAATTFEGVSTANLFFTNLTAGTILRLSGPYDNREAGEVFKNLGIEHCYTHAPSNLCRYTRYQFVAYT